MKKYIKENSFFLLIVFICLLSSIILIGRRWSVESSNKTYDIILDYGELELMAEQSEHDTAWWLNQFQDMGINYVGLIEENLCGVLCGLDTLEELVVYAKSKADFLRETLGIEKIPSKATFGRILSMVDGKQLGEVILDVLRERFGTTGKVIAVDGKAICSTARGENTHKALQILSAYVTDSGITLAQESIHEKTNEIPVFQEMRTYWDVESKVVTAGAIHCQRETSRWIVQKKGDYLFGLKENQPSLLGLV